MYNNTSDGIDISMILIITKGDISRWDNLFQFFCTFFFPYLLPIIFVFAFLSGIVLLV